MKTSFFPKNENFVADTVLMVRPLHFGYNAQTAESNHYQQKPDEAATEIAQKALAEADLFCQQLKEAQIEVLRYDDLPETPDALFPNNWIVFHRCGKISLFPMAAPNRRLERRLQVVLDILEENNFFYQNIFDYTSYENENQFLEGTGSLLIDRQNRVVYAARSERTQEAPLLHFCKDFNYKPILFDAFVEPNSENRVYHTNVLMALSPKVAVICLEAIPEGAEKTQLLETLADTGKQVLPISFAQKQAFAGNLLFLKNKKGKHFWVLSQTAFEALQETQKATLAQEGDFIVAAIPTIERIGGGSVRCMLAEVLNPKK
ncbi:citrulline utilization hydrolase CtlX [Hugenholtzia roseola]|uniref:citrulline utilization hydrolase CtlX n=1 Tax=Hugenholtzia roseola TaxID=1002 RepID=UPI00041AF781|nr:arginine deiminase-related protein [Hugenholtzia roseola]